MGLLLLLAACGGGNDTPTKQADVDASNSAAHAAGVDSVPSDRAEAAEPVATNKPVANNGIIDDRRCDGTTDSTVFLHHTETGVGSVGSKGEVLWFIEGVDGGVELGPQGPGWAILRNSEFVDLNNRTVARVRGLPSSQGILNDCRYLYSGPKLLGHDGQIVWNLEDGDKTIYGSLRGIDGDTIVWGTEINRGDSLIDQQGNQIKNLLGIAFDGSIKWSKTVLGEFKWKGRALGVYEKKSNLPTLWHDGETGNELFRTDARLYQIRECGSTLWFFAGRRDETGLEVYDSQTGALLFSNESVSNVAIGYDGYGEANFFGEGSSAGYQIDDAFTFVPDCNKPKEAAWTAQGVHFENHLIITTDLVHSAKDRVSLNRATGEVVKKFGREEAYIRPARTPDALIGTLSKNDQRSLVFLDQTTFEQLAVFPDHGNIRVLRIPQHLEQPVVRLNRSKLGDVVANVLTGEILVELE